MRFVKNIGIHINMYIHLVSVCLLSTVAARELTDEELYRFPKLFHLDNYERCLAPKAGLYCLGTFELTASQPLPILELMKEYTKQQYTFNRTLLRRGYCVSERCPTSLRSEHNATLRFEGCVAKYARRYALTAQLKNLHYCITHQQRQEEATRAPNEVQMLLLYAIACILLLNVIGTLYHCYMGDDSNKNIYIMAWSLRSNWAQFTKIEETGIFAELAPLQGIRLLLQWIAIFAHTAWSHFLVFVQNVEYLERLFDGSFGIILRNGSSYIQIYILISCFLTGYYLLLAAQRVKISAIILIKWILKRLARILPAYLLVLGYAVSWWPRSGDSPQFPALVGRESQICRNKFWYQVLFINNLVKPTEWCMLQSWAFAVDMQLYIFSTLLTLLLMRMNVRAVPILLFLFAASGVLNVLLAYFNGWDPVLKITRPESLRHLLRETSVHNTNLSTWSHLPGCFLGLLTAHIYFEMKNQKVKVEDEPEIKKRSCNGQPNGSNVSNRNGRGENNRSITKRVHENEGANRYEVEETNGSTKNEKGESNELTENGEVETNELTENVAGEYNAPTRNGVAATILKQFLLNGHIYVIPSILAWIFLTAPMGTAESPVLTALHVGLERVVITLLFLVFLIQLITADNFMRRFWTRYGWQVLGRLAFSVMLLHWCITLSLVAGRSEAIRTSLFYVTVDYLVILFYAHLLAIPMYLLVELPAQKFLGLLLFPTSLVRV